MNNNVDGRGSKDQRTIYDYLVELYPSLEIIYEFPLYEVNQRVDIFIPALGLAIEYSGRQHSEYVQHFHKDFEGYIKGRKQDQKKIEYLALKGAKLVIIKHNEMVDSAEKLKEIIDSVEYPPVEYSGIDSINPKKQERLEKEREYRRKAYQKLKERKKK